MDENKNDPFEINSNLYANRKRKLQYEMSGLPLPKHKCWDKTTTSECDFPSDPHLDTEELNNYMKEGKNKYDQLEGGSAKDSNSFSKDADSVMSVSDEAKTELQYLMISPYDRPSPSSANWGGNSANNSINSLDSRLETKTSDDVDEHNSPNPDIGFYTSPNYEVQFENPVDCKDKEIEDFLYSNDVIPNNFVLSSGRWNVNEEPQQGTEKLTIDKEFEQYFSMLML